MSKLRKIKTNNIIKFITICFIIHFFFLTYFAVYINHKQGEIENLIKQKNNAISLKESLNNSQKISLNYNKLEFSNDNFYSNNIVSDEKLINFMKDRARLINNKAIRYSNLNTLATDNQLKERVSLILKHAKELNYLYPTINYQTIALDFLAIVEFETGFINYANLDGGLSGGITSMQFIRAKELSKELGIKYSKEKFLENMNYQIKLGVYNFYNLINTMGSRRDAWSAYNTGEGWRFEEHWRNYTFSIEGRVNYYKELILNI